MINIFLSGDVMLGRGIDQILKFKNNYKLYESSIKDARDYVPKNMYKYTKSNNYKNYKYIWGILLNNPEFIKTHIKIINLETSVTTSNERHLNKSVLYKMHPYNLKVLKIAKINYCSLANNHILDWGVKGLKETIKTFKNNNILYSGIGKNIQNSLKPSKIVFKNKKIKIFAIGDISSGIPLKWKATNNNPGVNLININNLNSQDNFIKYIKKNTKKEEMIIVSIHWGSNWGWKVSNKFKNFAHKLIDLANVDIIHGHSSHHVRPIEIYKKKLILYGCGDLINDYEIIDDSYKKQYLSRISLAYFCKYDKNNNLKKLKLLPLTIKNMQIIYANNNMINNIKKKIELESPNIKLIRKNKYLIYNL